MIRLVRLGFLACLSALVACGGGDPVEIKRVSTDDITVRVMAVPVPMATRGEVVVTPRDSNQELARIRVIQADDYVEDVRRRIKNVRGNGKQVTICIVYPQPGQPSTLFTSEGGTVVKLIDAESNARECQ